MLKRKRFASEIIEEFWLSIPDKSVPNDTREYHRKVLVKAILENKSIGQVSETSSDRIAAIKRAHEQYPELDRPAAPFHRVERPRIRFRTRCFVCRKDPARIRFYLVPGKFGGRYATSNSVPLCPACFDYLTPFAKRIQREVRRKTIGAG